MDKSQNDMEGNESLPSSKEPSLLPSISESAKKVTDDTQMMRLPSHIDIDTIDYSNCATSPSGRTLISSIPGTIYYNGLDSVTQPHIENARKVSESSKHVAENNGELQKTRPSAVRVNSESSNVPQMQWTPPQPLSGNGQVQSSKPQYAAHAYTSSTMQSNVVPAVPIEELSMDGFTDTVRKRGVEKVDCGKMKGYKALICMTALIIVLSMSAVVFSIIYVRGSDSHSTQIKYKTKKEDEKPSGRRCHHECYDPFKAHMCRCACYTPKDDKYYTCGSQTDGDPNDGDPDDGDQDNDNVDDDLIVDDNSTNVDDNLNWYSDDHDDDDSDDAYGDFYGPDPIYDNTIVLRSCPFICYRKYIHRNWDPTTCYPTCYDNVDQFEARWLLWMEWFKQDIDANPETPPPTITATQSATAELTPEATTTTETSTESPTDEPTWEPTVSST